MQLIFASANKNKISEIRQLLPSGYELLALADIGFNDDIPETANTIEGNARLKTQFLTDRGIENSFSDDTGLVISGLNGEPGVYSARYAGEAKNAEDNMELVLSKLNGNTDRSAYFITVIALWINNEMHVFRGRVDGTILTEKRGDQGFGYDPIFQPIGYTKTFAEMSAEEKNSLSHRGRALDQMIRFLKTTPIN